MFTKVIDFYFINLQYLIILKNFIFQNEFVVAEFVDAQ